MFRSITRQNRRAGVASIGGWLLIVIFVAAVVYAIRFRGFDGSFVDPREVTPRGELFADEQATIRIFREASPSVVHITTLAVETRRMPWSFDIQRIPKEGTGSGFIWDSAGHIVTNYHVIQGAQEARVTLADGSTWRARLVGFEREQDLAVIKIDAGNTSLRPIPIGTSADLQVGQKVFAIGNPFGLDQTLTTGVISGLDREIHSDPETSIQGVIQTDAAINPGNSGGPSLDSSGRLIGVNTAIYSPSGAYAGVGFAVPVDVVNQIVPQLIRFGKKPRPGLGITFFPTSVVRANLGRDGVLIRTVVEGGAADRGGLLPTRQDEAGRIHLGDLIIAINDAPIDSVEALLADLGNRSVGETINITVLRGDSEVQSGVTLQALPLLEE